MERRLWLYVAIFIALLPAMWWRDFTPGNELRYLSIADEALAQGRWFAFSNHGVPYADKPPLYLWIVMAGRSLFGFHSIFFLSLFSIVPALVTCELMVRMGRGHIGRGWQPAAILTLMGSGMFLGAAIVLRMDMLMTMWIVLSLYLFWRGRRRWFPLAVFLALFTKGPLGLLFPLITTVAWLLWMRRGREIWRWWGWYTWGILVVLCAAWFTGVYLDGGREYIDNLLFHQTMGRAVNAFHHKKPFWFYFETVPYSYAPWAPLMLVTVAVGASMRWRRGLSPWERLMLVQLVGVLLFLTCLSGKLEIYFLPAVPFLVFLGVHWLPLWRRSWWVKALAFIPLLAFAGAPVIWAFMRRDYPMTPTQDGFVWAGVAILLCGAFPAAWHLFAGRIRRTLVIAGGTLFAAIFVATLAVPGFNPYLGYHDVARAAAQLQRQHPDAALAGYRMRNSQDLDVFLGTAVPEIEQDSLETFVGTLPPGQPLILMVPTRRIEGDPALQPLRGLQTHPVGCHTIYLIER